MKVLLSWLQEFAAFPDDPEMLAETMTDLGMVVEETTLVGPSWDGIVVAKVAGLRGHPEADRIQLVDIDQGNGEPLQVCCGAFNMAVGDLVPFATLGTTMPNGLEIERRKLRGEWSNGMICSASELELGEDSDGIMVLEPDLKLGDELATALGQTTDTLFDLDIEGNRPDALSVAGVARDLAARLGLPFTISTPTIVGVEPSAADRASVKVEDRNLCPRFSARVLENVTIGDSPPWVVARLTAAGMRPINSIVDISNYVMLELGQPNHTYDLDLVNGSKLGVRMGREGERVVTLDGVERNLTDADGVIVDGNDDPIGLAGVMGGASTEIGNETTTVLLEAAVWDRMTIAKTSRRLNLRSEASNRFERGADPAGIERALDRFSQLAVELCGAKIAEGVLIDGDLVQTPLVPVRVTKVNHLLNTALTSDQITSLLTPIGFVTEDATEEVLQIRVPSWRPDSTIEEDIVEEIGRHYGYDRSGKRVPTPTQAGSLTPAQLNRRRVRRALLGAGFTEAMPMPFLAPGDLEKAGLEVEGLALTNPLVAEESILRSSLLPGLLKAVARNEAHRQPAVQFYELGRVFGPSDQELPQEFEMVAGLSSGHNPETTAVAVAVQSLQRFFADLGISGEQIRNAEIPGLHPTRSAEVHFRGKLLGAVGEVDPRVAERFGVSTRVAWFQLLVAPLLQALTSNAKYQKISLYPSSDIDLAFVTPDAVPATDVERTLRKAGGELLRSVRLFDVFRGEQLGADCRSLAFQLRFQAADRTLTDEEVSAVRQACIDAVAKTNKASLR